MIGPRIRAIREMRGYTQEELAERMGINTHNIWRWENGESKPNGDTIAQIAKVLEVSADYLLGLNNDPMPGLQQTDLSVKERRAIAAWRQGDIREAIKEIVNDGEAGSGS